MRFFSFLSLISFLFCLILPVFCYFFITLGNTGSSLACGCSSSSAGTARRLLGAVVSQRTSSGLLRCCSRKRALEGPVSVATPVPILRMSAEIWGFPCSGERCGDIPVCCWLLTTSSLMSRERMRLPGRSVNYRVWSSAVWELIIPSHPVAP